MARTVVGYIKNSLNNSASASPTQSVEVVTGTPIGTGTNVGAWQEFSDNEALSFSSKQIVGAQITTAGSGQTPGTYTVTASTGGAQISVVVAGGGTVTAAPTVINGGTYTADVAPTFTLTGTGGTPATLSAVLGFLYDGVYAFVQMDSAVTVGAIPVGTPLYWLQGQSGFVVTTVLSGNFPDFAGWSIDPQFNALNANGQRNLYAFMQMNGKGKLLFPNTGFPATYGDTVNIVAGGATFTSTAGQTTSTPLTVGYALGVGTANSVTLARVIRAQSRF